jgi:transcriptional regulator with XRE-family HTH domain
VSKALTERFADNLKYHRAQAGLSQEEVAIRAEIHRSQIHQLEHALQIPKIDTLVKLAGALGISAGDLLDGLEFEPAISSGKFKITPAKRDS